MASLTKRILGQCSTELCLCRKRDQPYRRAQVSDCSSDHDEVARPKVHVAADSPCQEYMARPPFRARHVKNNRTKELSMSFATNESLPYLKPRRLEDVVFLIQYLGRGDNASFQSDGAENPPKPLDGHTPRLTEHWLEVAKDHPEFFRVAGATSTKEIYLWHRFYQKAPRPPLDFAQVQQVVDNALKIHERQLKQDERVKWALPLWFAFAGVILNCLLQVWFHFSK
jgi:hypothetical protein